MRLFIPKDILNNSKPPRLFLCTQSGTIIGELPNYETNLVGKWNAYSELTFSIDRQYTDILTGETKVHPLFDKTESPRQIYVENIGYFVLQDIGASYGDKDSKALSAFSIEYATGTKYLESFKINTGEIDSAEVTYLSSIYGNDYTIDSTYALDTGVFDAYQSYYVKEYTDADTYTYQQVQINTNAEHLTYNGSTVEKTLYVKKYPNVRFYFPTNQKLSLLHLIFAKIPEWKIGNVDASLWRKERKFDEERIAIYDFLMNNVSDTFNCVIEWDTITKTVNFYEEAEDGITEDNTVQTIFDTDVYISRENLANEINVSYSTDDIKTKLKVTGADSLDIREINLGKNYIMNLDYFHTLDWMEEDLFEAYDKYLETVKAYSPQYTIAMQSWVGANNKYNDFMNAVPAEGNVVLIGDEFKKLYCVYTPVYEAGATQTVIDTAINTATIALIKKLNLYHVDEDINANKTDNILLRLKNADDDTATIRIYDPKIAVNINASFDHNATYYTRKTSASGVHTYTKVTNLTAANFASQNKGNLYTNNYKIQTTIIRATSGLSDQPSEYTLSSWVKGDLTTTNSTSTGMNNLKGFNVTYIGTMGAYFVLAKDESQKENIEDYGVNLLKEKHDTYTTIFQAQTEAMYSQEQYQCTVGNEPPTGAIPEGTKWLDSDSNPTKLYTYTSGKWEVFSGDVSNYENYQRYIDNYNKLQAVQEVLVKKERMAEYCLNGFIIPDRSIPSDSALETNMNLAAQAHFNGYTIRTKSFGAIEPYIEGGSNEYLYTFTTSFDSYANVYVVYLNGKTPYVAYADAQGVCQIKMNRISRLTEMQEFFTEEQWIRLSPLIREDEFSDDNFLLTGYESEEERLEICRELMESANRELNTLCQPSLEFTMTMANILALPEFKSLIDQFQLGNFVRVHIRDGYVKRARLLEVRLNFDDLSDFSCDFGNLITTKSEIDKHAQLLAQAVTAGKQVATAASDWQRAVDKSNKLEEAIASGLQDGALSIGSASGQAITWDSQGIRCRKYKDGSMTEYEDEQIAIINNKLVFTNDGWKTSKAILGEFTIELMDNQPQTMYGLLADALVGGYVKGSVIEGGSLKIGGSGGQFIVNEDGSVQILGPDEETPVFATQDEIDVINKARQYHTELRYTGSTIFTGINQSCVIECRVFSWDDEITDKLPAGTTFKWYRNSNDTVDDKAWNASHIYTDINKITITNEDIKKNAQFYCECTFDDSKITTEEVT